MNYIALAVLILVSSGASYGQRSLGGVNKADLELLVVIRELYELEKNHHDRLML